MNCNNNILQYKGTKTFTFDGVTYNKVKVTKSWNRIGIRHFNKSTKEVKYFNIYEVPVGEYSHTELYNAIYNCMQNFCTYTGVLSVSRVTKNPYTNGSNPFPSKTYTSFSNRYQFSGISYGGDIFIDIVAVPNGIQTILPFTLPMPFVHNKNADYPSRNSDDNRFAGGIQIFNSGYFFDMIWLNPLFFYHKVIDCQYPNNFTGFACNYNKTILFSDVKTGSPNSYINCLFTVPPGVYSEYGYIIALLVSLVNSSAVGVSENLRFIIYEEDNKIKVRRSGNDNRWMLPTTSITVNTSFAGYTVRNYSASYLSSINTFTLDNSEVKEDYLNYYNNVIMCNYNCNLCLHDNKFLCNYNINPMYMRYDYNKIKYI